ncbi:hypothetical protein F5Y16DRAFT_391403 [Xylariaceae sp. FL0255]|nr:hypothetical protein F5Y16DRAFT_391403 [Xylariaceae sp. FL0255]
MSERPSGGGWFQTDKKTYFLNEYGQTIVVRDKTFEYYDDQLRMFKDPDVIDGRYKPWDGAPSSWPRRDSPLTSLSRYDERHKPHFGSGSEHNGCGNIDRPSSKASVAGYSRPSISTDVFRDVKAKYGKEGPRGSAYDRDWHGYKSFGVQDEKVGREYKE